MRATWLHVTPVAQRGTPRLRMRSVWILGSVSSETKSSTVPLAKLLSAEPQTFTLAGSIHLDRDFRGDPASIDYDWNLSLTVKRG
jgi:hypothetical protein